MLALACASTVSTASTAGGQGAARYDVQALASGVYAIVRHDPIGYGNNANSLVVIGDSGVLVVDAQFTREATLETLAAIRRLTPLPVRHLVNTHWHDDHAAGNQVYRDSFPDVAIIAQENTRADLADIGVSNRIATRSGAPAFIARLNRLMALGLGADSTPLVPLERAALESNVAIVTQYLTEAPGFRETLPTMTFSTRLTLYLGARRRVELRYFGPANTRGDAVVILPDDHIVATGDLLVAPVPFAFNAYVGGWVSALDSIAALRPAAIMPGHGPVMRDETYLVRVRTMLDRIRRETAAAKARGATPADARRQVTLADERAAVTHGDKWLASLFDSFFLGHAVSRAYEEAVHHPPALRR